MGLRIFQIAAALFWLGTVVWLVATVMAPPGSRMRGVEAEEAYMTFFRWNDTTNMALLENGRYRGKVSVSGTSGEDRREGRFLNSVSVVGSLEDAPGAAGGTELSWRGLLEFTEEMGLNRGEFSLRVPGRELSLQLRFGGSSGDTWEGEASLGGVTLFRREGSAGEGLPELPAGTSALLPALGLDPSTDLDPGAWKFDLKARRGVFPLGGRALPGYLLAVSQADAGIEIRIFFSEAGEPLRVETGFGFEAVSEMLVPLEAYRKSGTRRETSRKSQD